MSPLDTNAAAIPLIEQLPSLGEAERLELIMTAPDRLRAQALEAEHEARLKWQAGSPVGAREWMDVSVACLQAAELWST